MKAGKCCLRATGIESTPLCPCAVVFLRRRSDRQHPTGRQGQGEICLCAIFREWLDLQRAIVYVEVECIVLQSFFNLPLYVRKICDGANDSQVTILVVETLP